MRGLKRPLRTLRASQLLIGLNDFYAFCKTRAGSTTIRNLIKFRWTRKSQFLTAEVIADASCYSMVRGLVGAILQVGTGKKSINWPKEIMEKRKKVTDLNVVSPSALILEEGILLSACDNANPKPSALSPACHALIHSTPFGKCELWNSGLSL